MSVARINCHRRSLDEGYLISYLRLRIVVLAVGISVLAWLGGLDAGRVQESTQLLLLALPQAVDDAA